MEEFIEAVNKMGIETITEEDLIERILKEDYDFDEETKRIQLQFLRFD